MVEDFMKNKIPAATENDISWIFPLLNGFISKH